MRLYCILCDCAAAEFRRLNAEIEDNIQHFGEFEFIYSYFLRHAKISLGVDRLSNKVSVFIALLVKSKKVYEKKARAYFQVAVNVICIAVGEYAFINDFSNLTITELFVGILLMLLLVYEYIMLMCPAAYLYTHVNSTINL